MVTCMVAHAAAFAAEAASQPDAHRAAHLVAQSVDFVVHAFRLSGLAPDGGGDGRRCARDLEKLWMAEPDVETTIRRWSSRSSGRDRGMSQLAALARGFRPRQGRVGAATDRPGHVTARRASEGTKSPR